MEQKSMTALVSAFARAYHSQNNTVTIFNDSLARQLLGEEQYAGIAKSMEEGISFFNPSFTGTKEEALRWIVDSQLSPSPLGRAAFAEKSLECAVFLGARQYLILGAGYDTFAYRQPQWAKSLRIFEIDHPAAAKDKRDRLAASEISVPDNVRFLTADFAQDGWQTPLKAHADFHADQTSFCSVLGVSYYLSENAWKGLLLALRNLLPEGSSIVFDYPDETSHTTQASNRSQKQAALADGANETMTAGYSYEKMERLLGDCGFLIYEHLTPEEMTRQYFSDYNRANPDHTMTAFDHVNYCLAVRKRT